MKRLTTIACAAAAMLLSACVGPDGYGGGYYGASAGYGSAGYGGSYYGGYASYNSHCDYYSPPWGYPPNYCSYQIWNQPVYYGGFWYGGPIYYRHYGGHNLYWLHGGWRRDAWHGRRPHIDWNRDGNNFWRGERRRGRDGDWRRDVNDTPIDGGEFANDGGANNGDGVDTRRRGGRRDANAGRRPSDMAEELARERLENRERNGLPRNLRGLRGDDGVAANNAGPGGASNAPAPNRSASFRNNRGGDNVGGNRPARNSVARSSRSRASVSSSRPSRSSVSRSNAGRASISRNSGGRTGISRSAGRRGGATRGPRGRDGG